MWKDLLLVCVGGGVGSVLRFLTSRLAARYFHPDWLFLGTFTTNILGACSSDCFRVGSLHTIPKINRSDCS